MCLQLLRGVKQRERRDRFFLPLIIEDDEANTSTLKTILYYLKDKEEESHIFCIQIFLLMH